MSLTALDLFAGTGWGVACQQLGIDEYGVELMSEAVATREANGMRTIYRDVWEGLEGALEVPDYDLLIASPPCQTFSMAGKGAGRQALDEVIGLIDSRAYLDVAALRAFGERHDPRTALVLTPLAHVYRDAPLYVVLEQVPTVLPVWEKCAEVMRRWGYSVVVGILNAEQYGVPQTRKRAILIARADGVEARMPTPTHSAYYPRDRARLDPGVLPWVSMAEALGWGMTERPYMSVASGTESGGGTDPAALGGSGARRTVLGERAAGRWMAVPQQSKSWTEKYGERGRPMSEPAPTLRTGVGGGHGTPGFVMRPATSVATRDLVPDPGHNVNRFDKVATKSRNDGIRVTADEAAALQSYPPGFVWVGSKTSTFRQIGNAVPPLLARAVLEVITESA